MTTNDYINGVHHHAFPPLRTRLWHSSYHDRTVRSGPELDRNRRYISQNPALSETDEHHLVSLRHPALA